MQNISKGNNLRGIGEKREREIEIFCIFLKITSNEKEINLVIGGNVHLNIFFIPVHHHFLISRLKVFGFCDVSLGKGCVTLLETNSEKHIEIICSAFSKQQTETTLLYFSFFE